jgi:phosphomannomutase
MFNFRKSIAAMVTALMPLTSHAQIAENMRGEHWVEAGGNDLIKVYFSPKFVSTKDGLHSLIVKWEYIKPINDENSSIKMIKINCQSKVFATEYTEIYSRTNLGGALIAGGNYPTPLQWSDIPNAYDAITELLCKKN